MPTAILNRFKSTPTLPEEVVPAATFTRSFTDPPTNSKAVVWTGDHGTYARLYVYDNSLQVEFNGIYSIYGRN